MACSCVNPTCARSHRRTPVPAGGNPKTRRQQRRSARRSVQRQAAMSELSGKVALVTGATSGIGYVTADYLAGAARGGAGRGCARRGRANRRARNQLSGIGGSTQLHAWARSSASSPPGRYQGRFPSVAEYRMQLLVACTSPSHTHRCPNSLRPRLLCSITAHGADVILGVRNVEAGQKIAKEIM